MIIPRVDAGYRVLVVDDERAVLDAANDYLSACGFAVETARELEEAEALLHAMEFELVIADMRLTGVHGREGLELLRFVRRTRPQARIIVMTAHGTSELEQEARRRGADAFLEKPLPLSELANEAVRLVGAQPRAGSTDT